MILDEKPAEISKPKLLHSHELQLMLKAMINDQGFSIDDLLEGSGIDREAFSNPALRVSVDEELTLYSRMAACNRDPMLAVNIGQQLDLTNYGVLGFAMAASNTLREALQLSVEFAPLISWASHVTLANVRYLGQDMTRLSVQPSPADPLTQAMEIESWFASFHKITNQLVGHNFHFDSVHFGHTCGSDTVAPFRAFFQCPVYFEQAQHAIYFHREEMSRRLPHAQPEYAQITRELCLRSVETLKGERGLVPAVKAYIQNTKGVPTLERAAAHFNMAARTLRRRLAALDTSWQFLADECRYQEARRALLTTSYTLESISQDLGYSDVRSFRTAFKRWSGLTPSRFRQSQKASL
jgi:AraC-like DNA-binding protein